MAQGLGLYPPSIREAPPRLTAPGGLYLLLSLVVVGTLLLFFLFYLALLAGSALLVYGAVIMPMPEKTFYTALAKAGAVAGAIMLFLFLLKGLLKSRRFDDSLLLPIREADQPDLYAFIRRLSREIRAPFHARIYLSPQVNAGVFYSRSLLNLILPVRKNLVIGLGLVNALNVNEFKAVLAHEFGHFSQSATALGVYVYTATSILADMAWGRDAWDDLLAAWCHMDFRAAIFGWILAGVVWLLRHMLRGAFLLINLPDRALSRQMEFHADRVAVSVTGSDALIHALARLGFAEFCIRVTLQDLAMAADHGLYTKDLYFHHGQSALYLRRILNSPHLGRPPELPQDPNAVVRVFRSHEDGSTSIWSSHPSNSEREQNAKRVYIRSAPDSRPSSQLFRNPEEVRLAVTALLYQAYLHKGQQRTLSEPVKVQEFIDRMHAEPSHAALVHGIRVAP